MGDFTIAEIGEHIGRELGVSDWVAIDQSRIDNFAACTGDHQWIHVDVERAKRESPFRGPVAHGYLTLAMVAPLSMEIGIIPKDAAAGLNYGIDKVRFLAPVPAGARVRLRVVLTGVEPKDGGQAIMKTRNTLGGRRIGQAGIDRRNAGLAHPGERHGDSNERGTSSRTPTADSLSEQASRNTLALNPLVGLRGKDLFDSAGILVKAMVNEPRVAIGAVALVPRRIDRYRARQIRTRAGGRRQALRRSDLEEQPVAQRFAQGLSRLGRGAR